MSGRTGGASRATSSEAMVNTILTSDWPYSRQQAAYPAEWTREAKFWPSVGRVDNAWGDRNLVCSCPPIEEYQ